jgi:hypothetical protein
MDDKLPRNVCVTKLNTHTHTHTHTKEVIFGWFNSIKQLQNEIKQVRHINEMKGRGATWGIWKA